MTTAISAQDLAVLKDDKEILKDISINLDTGKIIGLLGPSGAGKTTLIRTIVGRQRITRGSLEVLGMPAGSKQLRQNISYMTQGTAVYPDLTAAENLRYFAAMMNAPKRRTQEVLKEVGMLDKAEQVASTLSGGEQSRLSLAIALLGNAKLLVLDEPTVGVDPVLRQQLWTIFRKIADSGATLIVSSHVMDEAERCDELLLIRNGQLLAQGTPHELREKTHTKSVEETFLKLVEKSHV